MLLEHAPTAADRRRITEGIKEVQWLAAPARPQEAGQELADFFLGVVRFADVAGIDLIRAAEDKLRLHAQRYPAGPNTAPDVTKQGV